MAKTTTQQGLVDYLYTMLNQQSVSFCVLNNDLLTQFNCIKLAESVRFLPCYYCKLVAITTYLRIVVSMNRCIWFIVAIQTYAVSMLFSVMTVRPLCITFIIVLSSV